MAVKVAVLGAGLIGAPLATRLHGLGHGVTVWNRSPDKTGPLAEAGVAVAPSAAEALGAAEIAIAVLSDADAIRSVALTAPARDALRGRTLLQLGTIAPHESREIAADVAAAGGDYLEAPILGSIPETREGRLIVMVGGPEPLFQRHRSFLESLGPSPVHVGPVGKAAALKLALNQLIGSLTTAFAQSLTVVQREEIPVDLFMEVLRGSALHAPTFDKKLDRMLSRNWSEPNFPTRHLLKDLDLFASLSRSLGIDGAMLNGVRQLVEQSVAAGHGDDDYSALAEALTPDLPNDDPGP